MAIDVKESMRLLWGVGRGLVDPRNWAKAGFNKLRENFFVDLGFIAWEDANREPNSRSSFEVRANWEALLSAVAEDVYGQLEELSDSEIRRLVEDMLQADSQAVMDASLQIARDVAADQSSEEQELLAGYLQHIPQHAREALKHKDDISGRTVSAATRFEKPQDILPLLPARLPLLRAGQKPIASSDYELVRLLGIGGFGEVWLARNPFGIHREVAIKFCTDAESRERLLRHEAVLSDRVMGDERGKDSRCRFADQCSPASRPAVFDL